RQYAADGDRHDRPRNAKAALDQIAQHQSQTRHQYRAGRHQTGGDWNQAGTARMADSTDILYHPVGNGDTKREGEQKGKAFDAATRVEGKRHEHYSGRTGSTSLGAD